MKPKYIRHLSVLGAIVFTANSAHAAPVTQTANDVFGTPAQSSFIEATRWSNAAVPAGGNTYLTNGFTFRTPATGTTAYTFAGDSLSVDTRSSASFGTSAAPTSMICKGTASHTLTFTSLILNGGIVGQGTGGVTTTLAGNISAAATSGFSISDGNDGRAIIVAAPISGSGRLYVGSNNSYTTGVYTPIAYTNTFTVSGNNSSFSGGWSLGGTYSPTFFGGSTTYNCTFNASATTFKVGNANALGTGTLELKEGTLNLNGFSPSGLAGLTVPDAATATIRTAGSTLTATAVNLGTTTGATLKIDNAGLGNPVTAPLASTTLTVNGPSTLSVLGTGLAVGTFPLISHAGAIAGAGGFAGITLALPPGVSGSLLNNPGSLDVNITAIEFIKWTGAISNNWNINTADTNWKTTVGLVDTTYQQNASGGNSVLFNESEAAVSPVAVAVPATVSPNAFSINNPTKDYTFSGAGGIGGTAAFVKDGAGTVTFSNSLSCTGGTTINGGKVALAGAAPSASTQVPTSIATGATLEFTSATAFNQGGIAVTGAGKILKSGAGTMTFNAANSTIALGAGGLIDVQAGKITFGNFDAQGCSATANQSDLNIAATATFDGYSGTVAVDKLTGAGTYQAGYFGPRSLSVGVNGGSSTFSGTIQSNGVDGNSQTQLIKKGNGTLTLTGKVNARGAFGGSSLEVRGGTIASPSTLTLSPTDPLSTTGYTGGRVYVSATNTDVTVMNQTAGTLVASTLSIGESSQATYNLSGGIINAGAVEFAYTGGGPNGPVEMNISGSSQLNVNSNGQILMGQFYGRSITVNQTGGTVAQFSDAGVTRGGTGKLKFGGGNQNLTWNLSGGTLSLAGMDWQASGSGAGGGNGVLNLNGGVLQITNAAFAAPTGTANSKPVVAAKVLGDDVTPNSGAIIDNYGLAVTFAAPILHGPVGIFDGGLKVATSVPGGSLTLSGVNTYTGTTTVNTGNTLVLDAAGQLQFALDGTNSNKLTGAGSATLNGAFAIDTTFADTTPNTQWTLVNVSSKTYGGTFSVVGFTNSSGVWTMDDGGGHTWTFTQSTGVLKVTDTVTSPYSSWIGGFTVGDASPGADADNDGMANLLEFVLNGNPSTSDTSILPNLVVTATNYEFTFQRRDDSLSPETTQIFQYGTDLTGWTDIVVPAASGSVGAATVTVIDGTPADTVKVSIPKSLASSGKLFGRLKVTKP